MYKSKLQEICQQRAWTLPVYDTEKHGLDHCPRFSATVTLNGQKFHTLDHYRSSKEAQNNVAKLAFDHFSLPNPNPNLIPNLNSSPSPSPSLNPSPNPNFNPNLSPNFNPSLNPNLNPSPNPNPKINPSPSPNVNPNLSLNLNLSPTPNLNSSPNPNPSPSPYPNHCPNPNTKPPIPRLYSFPQPSLASISGSSNSINELETLHATEQTVQQSQETVQTPHISGSSSVVNMLINESRTSVQADYKVRDVQHLYKNQLQNYAQKRNIVLPVYSCEREGPPHNTRFRSTVIVDGQSYESSEFFPTLKEAEHAAAKVALTSLSPDGVQEHDSGFYKNLLQELVQKEGIPLPMYNTTRLGEPHVPIFVSTVTINEEVFTGEEARSKKFAEMNAAKVAYNTLKERRSSQIVAVLCPTQQGQETPGLVSSCLKSNLSHVQQNARPKVPLISSPISSTVTAEQAKDDRGKGNSLSRDIMHGDAHGRYPSVPYEFQNRPSPHLASDCNKADVDSSLELSTERSSSLPCKRVCVYPRVQNMKTPEGCTMLPMSDDNWVAFSHIEERGN